MTAADPTIEAARSFVDSSLDAMRSAIAGASAHALNHRPGGDDTNPVAVLVVHAVNSTRWWLSMALGAPLPERDRSSEFRTIVTGPEELLAMFDPIAADCRALLDMDVAFDAGAAFMLNGAAASSARLGFACLNEQELREAANRLATAAARSMRSRL